MERVRLAVVINGTILAGAERMLARVLSRLPREEFEPFVFSLGSPGPMTEHLDQIGVPHQSFGITSRRFPNPFDLWNLSRAIKAFDPDVVQGWMYWGNLYGGIASKLARREVPVAWNIRHSTLDPQIDSRSLRFSAWLGAKFSRSIPERIVLCAEAAREAHLQVGYAADRLEVIPNGFDISEFRPDPDARARIRTELGIDDATPLVGLVGRLHPHKDHQSFVKAARVVCDTQPNTHFVLIGEEQVFTAADLHRWVDEVGLRDQFHWLGVRRDVPAINASLDVSVCCSTTEGFPNVVGEAMACGIPCVATDVGESAEVVGDTGLIVPPSESRQLGQAMTELLSYPPASRRELGRLARKRVSERYDIRRIVERYADLWRKLARPDTVAYRPKERWAA